MRLLIRVERCLGVEGQIVEGEARSRVYHCNRDCEGVCWMCVGVLVLVENRAVVG